MRVNSPSDLGQAVRSLRRTLGVTQPDLAMTAGTGLRFIVDLEKGKPTCQIGKALRVLATLGAWLEVREPRGAGPDPVTTPGGGGT